MIKRWWIHLIFTTQIMIIATMAGFCPTLLSIYKDCFPMNPPIFWGAISVPGFTRGFRLALRSSSYLCLLQSQSTILGWADVGCTQWMWGVFFFCVGKNKGLRWRWREVGWELGKVRMWYVLGVFPTRMQASPSNLWYDYVIRLSYSD